MWRRLLPVALARRGEGGYPHSPLGRGALAWIDPTLNSLSATAPGVLADFTRAGALIRTMILRAELARALGDQATAAGWARAVALLWAGADEFLQPAVRRMVELSR